MYRIKVTAPITNWNIETGYFTNCYRCKSSSEDSAATFIGFTDRKEEQHLIKTFKTYKAAQKKIDFLKQKIDENGYMWHWILEIEEVQE